MSAESTLRDSLNTADPNRLPVAAQSIPLGELLTKVIADMTPTEAALVPAAEVLTLAAQPTAVLQINQITGTTNGVKKLLKGPITGNGAVVPATGEAVWDGGTKILMAAVDAAATVDVTYVTDADQASILKRAIGEQD